MPHVTGEGDQTAAGEWVCRTWQRLWQKPRITHWVSPPLGHWRNTADSAPRPDGQSGNAKALPPLNSLAFASARRMKLHAAPPTSNPVFTHPLAGTALSCPCSSTGPSGTIIRVQDIPPGSVSARCGTSSFNAIGVIFTGYRQGLQGYRAEADHSISRRNTATLIAPCAADVMPPTTINLSPWSTAAAARSSPSLKDRLRCARPAFASRKD